MKKIFLLSVWIVFFLTGCQNSSLHSETEERQKIYLLETTQNYAGLIEIYRDKLKQQESDETRLKLANLYYLIGDIDSSIYYLKPMLKRDVVSDELYLLYTKNLLQSNSKNIAEMETLIAKTIEINANNGEAYNIQGIIQVRAGQFDLAEISFNQARALFYDDNKVLNNLAMLAILKRDYSSAYNHLMKLYTKGTRDTIIVHNLVYSLVKLGEENQARQLCIENKLSSQPTILINELRYIEPKEVVRFTAISPHYSEVKAMYQDDLPQVKVNEDTIASTLKRPELLTNPGLNSEVVDMRVGEHAGYSRLVIETINKINYSIKTISAQEYEITINNVTLENQLIERLVKRVKVNNRDLISISVTAGNENDRVIKIQTRSAMKINEQYLPPKGKNKHCLLFDFKIDS